MSQLAPYRTALIPDEQKEETYGLIIAKPLPKPHECSPPGFFKRILYFFMGQKVTRNSLFRCKSCGEVWRFGLDWDKHSPLLWIEGGGKSTSIITAAQEQKQSDEEAMKRQQEALRVYNKQREETDIRIRAAALQAANKIIDTSR